GEHAAGVEHEVPQQLELGGGELELDAGAVHLVAVLVELEVAHAHDGVVVRLASGGASQHGADAGDDLLEAERFGDVVVSADGQALDLVLGVVAGGEEQHGGVPAGGAHPAGDGESVHVGQHDVQHDEVRLGVADEL